MPANACVWATNTLSAVISQLCHDYHIRYSIGLASACVLTAHYMTVSPHPSLCVSVCQISAFVMCVCPPLCTYV